MTFTKRLTVLSSVVLSATLEAQLVFAQRRGGWWDSILNSIEGVLGGIISRENLIAYFAGFLVPFAMVYALLGTIKVFGEQKGPRVGLAVAFAMIALASPDYREMLMGLGGDILMIITIILIVFLLLIGLARLNAARKEASAASSAAGAEYEQAKSQYYQGRAEKNKEKNEWREARQELKKGGKKRERERQAMRKIDWGKWWNVTKKRGEVLNKLRNYLRALQHVSDSDEGAKLKENAMKEVAVAIDLSKKDEERLMKDFEMEMSKAKTVEFKFTDDELNDVAKLDKIFSEMVDNIKKRLNVKPWVKVRGADGKEINYIDRLREHAKRAAETVHNLHKQKEGLFARVESDYQNFRQRHERFGEIEKEMQGQVYNNDFPAAAQSINELLNLDREMAIYQNDMQKSMEAIKQWNEQAEKYRGFITKDETALQAQVDHLYEDMKKVMDDYTKTMAALGKVQDAYKRHVLHSTNIKSATQPVTLSLTPGRSETIQVNKDYADKVIRQIKKVKYHGVATIPDDLTHFNMHFSSAAPAGPQVDFVNRVYKYLKRLEPDNMNKRVFADIKRLYEDGRGGAAKALLGNASHWIGISHDAINNI
ncbi:hypothetical protein JXB02_00465 [Candidatus Woesearchaeota archaeon]|nr:hypothetical protein [Candidatus Woesearchaeota archaeon]